MRIFQKADTMVTADLGFEDCSARVTNVPDEAFKSTHLYVAEHEEIYAKVSLQVLSFTKFHSKIQQKLSL